MVSVELSWAGARLSRSPEQVLLTSTTTNEHGSYDSHQARAHAQWANTPLLLNQPGFLLGQGAAGVRWIHSFHHRIWPH